MKLLNLSVEDIFNIFVNKYISDIGTSMKIGSEEFILSDIFSYSLGVLSGVFENAYKNTLLESAQGEYLDKIGNLYGLPRISFGSKRYLDVCANADLGSTLTIKGIKWTRESKYDRAPLNISRYYTSETLSTVPSKYEITDLLYEENKDKFVNLGVCCTTGIYGDINFEYTDEGDNNYRKYIEDNKLINFAGLAGCIEQQVKSLHPCIDGCHVVRQSEPDFTPGVIKLYLDVNLNYYIRGSFYVGQFQEDMQRYILDLVLKNKTNIQEKLTLGQTLGTIEYTQVGYRRPFYEIIYSDNLTLESIKKFVEAVIFYYNTILKSGTTFNNVELERLLITPIKSISENHFDFGITEEGYNELLGVKAISVNNKELDEYKGGLISNWYKYRSQVDARDFIYTGANQ